MREYSHPVSGEKITGIRLGPGAILKETDRHNVTSGGWGACPCAGATLMHGYKTIWVRPASKLSPETTTLLVQLSMNGFAITNYGYWRVIPTPTSKYDGRMDGRVFEHQVRELVEHGLVCRDLNDEQIYKITDAGHELAKTYSN